jgi:hypothetical protein
MVTAASFGSLVDGGVMSRNDWVYVSAIIQGVATMPLVIMFYFTAAAVFKASYNWVLVSGLSWLVGVGLQVPKNVLIFTVQLKDLEQGIITNNGIVITVLVNLIMFIAFSVVLYFIFRKHLYIITEKGMGAMR